MRWSRRRQPKRASFGAVAARLSSVVGPRDRRMKPLQHESLAEMSESALVHALLADAHWRSRVTNIHGIPDDAVPYPEVPLGNLGNGDVDILLVPPTDFSRATAVQVKRIKVHEPTFATQMPGKLSEIRKLQRQANLLAGLGFWQVY